MSLRVEQLRHDVEMRAKVVDTGGELRDQHAKDDDDDDAADHCGLFGLSPLWCRRLAVFPVFMCILCINAMFQGMLVNGFTSTSISSIEKRFSLSSTKSGIFSASYDVAVAAMLLPLSFWAAKVNKVRSIGLGMLLVGLGSIIICVPQFIDGNYTVGALTFDHCSPDRTTSCDEKQTTSILSFPTLILSQLLIGVGAAPLFTYGYSTMDDFDAHVNTGKNMAIFMAVTTVGPAIAFVGGGQLLKIWGDIGKTTPQDFGIEDAKDPRWYGAWWIGFGAVGILSFISAIPLLMFPRKLRDTDERKKNDIAQTHASLMVDYTGDKWEVFKLFKLFATNATCLCLVAMQSIEAMLMNAYITFIPKIFESLFGFSASWSSSLTGIIVVPMGVIGSIIGGKVCERYHTQVPALLKFCMAFVAFNVIASSCLLLTCEPQKIAGFNAPYFKESNFNTTQVCNAQCHCENIFNPVCNKATNISMLSPCHAGCPESPDGVHASEWASCSCSATPLMQSGHSVTKGFCEIDCGVVVYIFFALFSVMACFTFASGPIMQNIVLRVVSFKHRDVFICFNWMFMRILGSIPGAIGMGKVIDLVCLQWIYDCEGNEKCAVYNAPSLSRAIFVFTVVLKTGCMIALSGALYHYRPIKDCDDPTIQSQSNAGERSESTTPTQNPPILSS